MVSSQLILPCFVMVCKQFGMEPTTFRVRVFKWPSNRLDCTLKLKISSLSFTTLMHELGCKQLIHTLWFDMVTGSDLKFRKINYITLLVY